MKLHVTLTGMCLFVRDPGARKMHVLMPSTGKDPKGGPHVHAHAPFLVYDLRHEDPFSAAGPRIVPLNGWAVDLSGAAGTGDKLKFASGVVDLHTLVKRKLDHVQLDRMKARKSVVSLVTLPRATEIVPGRLVEWEFDGVPFHLTHQITWVVEGVGGSGISIVREKMRGSGTEPIAELRPFAADGTIRLDVVHLPDGPEPQPTANFEADHFAAYYRPYKKGHPKGPLPVLKTLPFAPSTVPGVMPGGTPFTCMVAQVTPE